MDEHKSNSIKKLKRLRVQGYSNISDKDLSKLSVGNRFAYQMCSVILIYGVVTANIPVLFAMMTIAFFGVVLRNHPFDYIYNYGLRQILTKPKLPPRSKQLKFACTIATLWIGATIYLFYDGFILAGYIVGGLLVAVALLVSITDICMPSIIYNSIFNIKIKD